MLQEKFYPVLLVLFVFIRATLCGGSRNVGFGIRKLKERTVAEQTSSYNQNVPGLEVRQVLSHRTSDTGPVTDITTQYDTVYIPPTSQAPATVVVTFTSTSITTTSQSFSTSTSTSTTSKATSQRPLETSGASCNSGYFLCDAEYNGGCCKNGFTCAIDSCIPPATVTEQRTCSAGSNLCPASLNYGCCPGGFQCDAYSCLVTNTGYSTMPVTNPGGAAVTSIGPGAVGIITKASEINLLVKQSATSSATPTPTPTPQGSKSSGIVIGGIAAGCVIGVLALILVAWFTYRQVKSRSNTDPPLSVATTNFYDPTAVVSRNPGSGSSARYRPVVQETHMPKQPVIPGYYHQPPPQHPPPPADGVVELGGTSIGFHGQVLPGELPGDDRPNVYEVEGSGTLPGGNTRRWSRPFAKRESGNYGV